MATVKKWNAIGNMRSEPTRQDKIELNESFGFGLYQDSHAQPAGATKVRSREARTILVFSLVVVVFNGVAALFGFKSPDRILASWSPSMRPGTETAHTLVPKAKAFASFKTSGDAVANTAGLIKETPATRAMPAPVTRGGEFKEDKTRRLIVVVVLGAVGGMDGWGPFSRVGYLVSILFLRCYVSTSFGSLVFVLGWRNH